MPNDKKMFVFSMVPEVAMLFYELCDEYKLTTEDERVSLLAFLAKEGLINSVSTTNRTKEQIVADYKKHFVVLDMTEES